MAAKLRLAGVNRNSIVDGTGLRYTIFTQGCKHNCEGCHNPETHDMCGGQLVSVEDILADIGENNYYDGVTLSGGDPFFQAKQVAELVKQIKGKWNEFDIWAYTGFTFEQILKDTEKYELLKSLDVIVDGRYEYTLKTMEKAFVGSTNQRIINVQDSLKQGKVVEMQL